MKRYVPTVLLVAAICAMLFGGGYMVREPLMREAAHYTNDVKYRGDPKAPPSKNLAKFSKMNNGAVYMLKLPNTSVNYPVMSAKGKGNNYYIYHDAGGDSSVSGALFLDERTPHGSVIEVIHGHHMRDGSMFGVLEKFKDGKYAKKHKYALLADESGTYRYRLCYVLVTSGTESGFDYYRPLLGGAAEQSAYLTELKDSAAVSLADISGSDKLLVLSTCSYEFENARTVLFYKKLNKDKSDGVGGAMYAEETRGIGVLLSEVSFTDKVNAGAICFTVAAIVIFILQGRYKRAKHLIGEKRKKRGYENDRYFN